ncbi:hypothetical protein PoB_005579300 [Plakobranchus ocellatus]|uniref:Uncharacterized protein n=1 Tax=Plakobranchus ocellatus TaxID=259542 RepID=A0AAV4CBP4_9GAST|nr:hypothetical protein PoB_005579300 [Plakobranchus ocellatus]
MKVLDRPVAKELARTGYIFRDKSEITTSLPQTSASIGQDESARYKIESFELLCLMLDIDSKLISFPYMVVDVTLTVDHIPATGAVNMSLQTLSEERRSRRADLRFLFPHWNVQIKKGQQNGKAMEDTRRIEYL